MNSHAMHILLPGSVLHGKDQGHTAPHSLPQNLQVPDLES